MNLKAVAKALGKLMDEESAKGADEGLAWAGIRSLAYELAQSLKHEVEEGGVTALQNLPMLKQAILDYAIEQAPFSCVKKPQCASLGM